MMHENGESDPAYDKDASKSEASLADEKTIRPGPGETDTTRFGMEDGDNTDVPSTGIDPERQSNAAPENGKAQ